jgi:hypothetical protein
MKKHSKNEYVAMLLSQILDSEAVAFWHFPK